MQNFSKNVKFCKKARYFVENLQIIGKTHNFTRKNTKFLKKNINICSKNTKLSKKIEN